MANKWSIDKLQQAWQIAARMHDGQKYGGQGQGEQIEYMNHIGSVTFEVLAAINESEGMDANLAIHCAILHDVMEDTPFSHENVQEHFGEAVAYGVLALTKNDGLADPENKMADSLKRIKEQPKEIWAVKMADRICNLHAPPFYWKNDKKLSYIEEAKLIHSELKDGNEYLANRLLDKIELYRRFIN